MENKADSPWLRDIHIWECLVVGLANAQVNRWLRSVKSSAGSHLG